MTKRKIYYEEYLKSEHWTNLRKEVLKRDNYKCVFCGYDKKLQCHHIKYRTDLTTCTEKDIKTLCKRCHKYIHNRLDEIRHEKRTNSESKRLSKHERKLRRIARIEINGKKLHRSLRAIANFNADDHFSIDSLPWEE